MALNTYQWKLNPKKCIFGVPSGILLGNVVSHDGICPNPTKVKAVLDMQPLKTSRISRSLLDVWSPSAASSHDSARRAAFLQIA
jgi:hypothetical protein